MESIENPSVTMQPIGDMLERAYQARDEMIERLGAKEGEGDEPKLNAPSKEMIAAYRLQFFEGYKTQEAIATKLSDEFGKNIHQGQVSRWLRVVTKWIQEGNVLPNIPGLTHEPQSVDPAMLDMGIRQDGHTPRQRDKWKDDSPTFS